MFFVGFKAPSFLHIFAIRKMKSRTPEPELNVKTYCLGKNVKGDQIILLAVHFML